MKIDVIRAVEACYSGTADPGDWLDGLLEGLSPGADEPRVLAEIWEVGRDGNRIIECDANCSCYQGQCTAVFPMP